MTDLVWISPVFSLVFSAVSLGFAIAAYLSWEMVPRRLRIQDSFIDGLRDSVNIAEMDVDRLKDKADESETRLKDVEEVLVTVVIALNKAGLLDSALTEQDKETLAAIQSAKGVTDWPMADDEDEKDAEAVMEALHAPCD